MTKLLDRLDLPKDLHSLSISELETLAGEIRELLVEIGDHCGGHLASNLGIVEVTLAIHALFDSPTDKFLWDTSHQTYVHKILTGRKDKMLTIRQYKGLSGFAKIEESEHDTFGAGHAATSLSVALGIAQGRDILKEKYSVVAVAGDAAFSCGMTFEALNNFKELKSNFICILNDNDMSISAPIGHMAEYMTKLRSSQTYDAAKAKFERIFSKIPRIGTPLVKGIELTIERMRDIAINESFGVIFEEFGFKYLGPIDGHNLVQLMAALRYAKDYPGPIMLHVHTVKGKGHELAEKNPTKYHGVSPKKKSLEVGVVAPKSEVTPSITYTQIFGEECIRLAKKYSDVVVITPAMQTGSGLVEYSDQFADRYFDVGIAEEHAVTFSAGLARAGLRPILAIYSTFLQRGFDQVIHDVCLQDQRVVFAMDRAGVVGEDGPTHHGVFDIAYLLPIPNLNILAPKDGTELREMLELGVLSDVSTAIRYPKGSPSDRQSERYTPCEIGKAEVLFESPERELDVLLIGVGSMVWPSVEVAEMLRDQNIGAAVINLRSIKPLDTECLSRYINRSKKVYVLEEGTEIGGAFSHILHAIVTEKPRSDFAQFAFPDEFVEHGKVEQLKEQYGLTPSQIFNRIQSEVTAAISR